MRFVPVGGSVDRDAATILIADTSPAAGRVYAAICHLAGYATAVCAPEELSGPLPRGCRPDLLIFGHLGGSRKRPVLRGHLATVPAILLSGFEGDQRGAQELGYDAVVARPVVPSELRGAIRNVLAARTPRQQRAAGCLDGGGRVRMEAMAQMRRAESADLRALGAELIAESRRLRVHARSLRARAAWLQDRPR